MVASVDEQRHQRITVFNQDTTVICGAFKPQLAPVHDRRGGRLRLPRPTGPASAAAHGAPAGRMSMAGNHCPRLRPSGLRHTPTPWALDILQIPDIAGRFTMPTMAHKKTSPIISQTPFERGRRESQQAAACDTAPADAVWGARASFPMIPTCVRTRSLT